MPFKFSTIAALFVGASLLSAHAHAQGANRTKVGNWTATDFTDATNPGCSIGVDSSVPGSRMILGVSRKQSDPLTLVFRNSNWTIRPGTPVNILAVFDITETQINGIGNGSTITVELTGEALQSWVHLLTAGSILRVSFMGGSSPVWLIDLTGSSAAVNTMGQCIKSHYLVGVGLPFSLAFAPAPTTSHLETQAAPTTPAYSPAYEPGAPLVPGSNGQALSTFTVQQPNPTPERPAPASLPAASAPGLPPQGSDPIVATWSGSTSTQTRPFHVDGAWELQWANGTGYFSINIHKGGEESGKLVANTSDPGASSYYFPNGGDFYLEVKGSSAWQMRAVSVASVTSPRTVAPSHTSAPSQPVASAPSPARSVASASGTGQDTSETAFIGAVRQGQNGYAAAGSDFAKGSTRPDRKAAVCGAVTSPSVTGWTGKIVTLTTNGDGNGVVSVEIAPNIELKTWNNSLSDIGSDTLIKANSPVYRQLGSLRVGQTVHFSGRLFSDGTDCFKETSMTLSGSMSEPEYLFRFESIEGS